jgi:hypothetical protein
MRRSQDSGNSKAPARGRTGNGGDDRFWQLSHSAIALAVGEPEGLAASLASAIIISVHSRSQGTAIPALSRFLFALVREILTFLFLKNNAVSASYIRENSRVRMRSVIKILAASLVAAMLPALAAAAGLSWPRCASYPIPSRGDLHRLRRPLFR